MFLRSPFVIVPWLVLLYAGQKVVGSSPVNGGDQRLRPAQAETLEEEIIERLANERAQHEEDHNAVDKNERTPYWPAQDESPMGDFELDLDDGNTNQQQQGSNPVREESIPVAARGQLEQPFPPPIPKPSAMKSAMGPEKRDRAMQKSAAAGGSSDSPGDFLFVTVAAVCTMCGALGIVVAAVSARRLRKKYKAAEDADYGPHYGVTGPAKERSPTSPAASAGDLKLASSAHLYHFENTKKQIIAMERSACDAKDQESEESDAEGDDADYSVYECPGLAPTGDIEVSNPLFDNHNGHGVSPPQSAKGSSTGGSAPRKERD